MPWDILLARVETITIHNRSSNVHEHLLQGGADLYLLRKALHLVRMVVETGFAFHAHSFVQIEQAVLRPAADALPARKIGSGQWAFLEVLVLLTLGFELLAICS